MTKRFECEDKDRLIGWLYGETSDDERAAIDAHLTGCAICAGEAEALRGVRVSLSAWQPPDAELGFRIVRDPEPAARRWWQVPMWVPSALAAGLVVALGASLAQVRVEYGDGTVLVRTAWSPPQQTAPAETTTAPASAAAGIGTGVSADEVRAAMADLERRLRAEMTSMRQAAPATPASAGVDRGELLRRVENLIEASEHRQQRELALRLAQVVRDVDTQRRADLVRIEQGMGEIEGLTGREAEQQRLMLNYLMRTSMQR